MADDDKIIGRLKLDITDIKSSVKTVNELLASIGVGAKVDFSKDVAKEVKKQLESVLKEVKGYETKINDAVNKAAEKISSVGNKKANDEVLKQAIALWKEYYEVMTRAQRAVNNGNTKQADFYRAEAEAIREHAIALKEEAAVEKEIEKVKRNYNAAIKAGEDKQAALDVRERAKAEKELAQNIKDRNKAQEARSQQNLRDETEAYETLVRLRRELLDLDRQATQSVSSGNSANANMYLAREAEIQKLIETIAKVYPELDKWAQADERVIEAEVKREAAVNVAKQKSEEIDYKNKEEAINAYANALVNLYNEQARFNSAVAAGKIREGSEEYTAAQQRVSNFEQVVIKAGSSIDRASIAMAGNMDKVRAAADALVQSEAKINDLSQVPALTQMETAYKNLTTAIHNYTIAKKSKDESGMEYWQNQINASMSVVGAIQEEVKTLNVDEDTRQRILSLIEQCKTAQTGFTAGVTDGSRASMELESQFTGILTRMFSLMAVIRTINGLISNTVEYVSQYYDKMNEIQMITLKSNEEVEELGNTYRQLAEDMNVSSLSMADAAIYLTRQGLSAKEIEERLRSITMYAKAANVDFTDASEIMTAVINSMGLANQEMEDGRNAAQRIADVFLNIGDNAATSGQEIGEAMQKAAAAAGSYGMSLEWLASYIATVSETTRQEARTIGTALNTIIARLHSIRTTGYNADDNTKINDIAKALNTVNIELMDQNGNWRDMEDIFEDVARVWNTLDGRQRSYIATTMAGVKQQNVFLALMKDMAKGAENGSRAYELYNKAISSAGTAEQKYAVYKESVTASQERLNVAQEKFYSLLDANVIKNWNNFFAGYVNMVTEAAEATGGLNIVLPIATGLIAAFALAVQHAGSASAMFASIWGNHPVLLAIAGVTALITSLVTVCSALAAGVETVEERFNRMSDAFDRSQEQLTKYISIQSKMESMFDDFGDDMKPSNEELMKYSDLLETLTTVSPRAKEAVEQLRQGLIGQKEAAQVLSEELDNLIEKEQEVSLVALAGKYANWVPNIADENSLGVLQNWEKYRPNALNDLGQFSDYLKDTWNFGTNLGALDTNNLDKNKYLTTDMINFIRKELSDYDYITNQTELWKQIAQDVWSKFFYQEGVTSGREFYEQTMNEMIDEALSGIQYKTDDTSFAILRERLVNSLFGEDGIASTEEWMAAGQRINQFIADIINNGIQLGPDETLRYIGKEIFGNYFNMIFSPDEIASVANDKELVDAISSTYSEMIEAGFTNADIYKIFRDLPLDDWDKGADILREKMLKQFKEKFNVDFLGELMEDLDLDTGETVTSLDDLLWDDLSLNDLKMIEELGLTLDEVNKMMGESGGSVDEFRIKLKAYAETVEGLTDGEEEAESFTETIKKLTTEINKFDKMIETIRKGKTVDFEDILNLADAHPEIMLAIQDTESLIKVLQQLKSENMEKAVATMRDKMLNDADFAQQSGIADVQSGQTLAQYKSFLSDNNMATAFIDQYIDQTIIAFLGRSKQLAHIGKDMLGEWMNGMFSQSNVDLLNRKAVQVGDDVATVLTETMTASADGKHGMQWTQDIVMNLTPITPDGKKLDDETFYEYVEGLLKKSTNLDELFANDKVANGGMGLLIGATDNIEEGWDKTVANYENLAQLLHYLQEAYYGVTDANKTWLDLQMEQAELNEQNNWAKSNGFIEQIGELQTMLGAGTHDELQAAYDLWQSYDDSMKKSISDTYPGILKAMAEVEAATKEATETDNWERADKAAKQLDRSLTKAANVATAKNFDKTYDAIQKLEHGTISATEAYDVFNAEIDKVIKAHEDVNDVTQKLAAGTEVTVNDVSNLADVLGMSADEILQDFPNAVSLFEELIGASGDLQSAFDALNEAAFLRITGVADADFSALQDGIITTKNMAQEMIDLLIATGQWDVETIPLDGKAWVLENGAWTLKDFKGAMQQVLKPTGKNPYKGTSSTGNRNSDSSTTRRSSGGGSSNRDRDTNKKQMTEVERALNRMDQMDAILGSQRSFYQAQSGYYAQTGRLQGVIGYSQKEIEQLNMENDVLNSNLAVIEKYMEAKNRELNATDMSSDKYEEVRDDLDKLQKAHQEYTKKLIDNQTAIEGLNDKIDESRKKIRDMQINIRSMIYKAIEDREKRTETMLQNEISMENTILDLIKQRYEKERDLILNNTDMKIDALQKERDLLSEQLEIRKEMAEAEDKAAKLAMLEANYQRIIADPTRKKEAQKIKDQIDELRDEMAWDAAEQEVKAQQDSIDQQITSLEDYKQYIEEYYEDLFAHPQKLIEEMRNIITRTDDEILDWLKANSDEYAASTENTQAHMVDTWQNTLDEMHGKIKTYWEEVEAIISQGDEAIIKFLMENSEEYARAGKLEAEKYVDEWVKALEDLHTALEKAFVIEAPTYTIMDPGTSSSGGSSSSGGYSGGSSSGSSSKSKDSSTTTTTKYGYKFIDKNNNMEYDSGKIYSTKDEALTYGTTMRDLVVTGYRDVGQYGKIANIENVKTYLRGGLASNTGLAWLDGTSQDPERVLSPYQTKLFETMVHALETMSKVNIPTMPSLGGIATGNSNMVSTGDIIVNVESLDSDADYEEMAQKVSEVLMEQIGRTAVVGGLRINAN